MKKQMFAGFVRSCAALIRRSGSGWVALLVAAVLPAVDALASDAVLLEFSSQYCGHCKALQPTLADLEQSGVPVRHVDVQAEPQLASRFGVRQTPTLVVLSSGKEVTRLVGMHSAAEIREALAINPSGPLIATGADVRYDIAPPQTKLAGLAPPNRRQPDFPRSDRGEAMPSIAQAGAIERARAATVRLRVHDGHGFGVGTGTIIDTHGEEALVMTCGHLFRETKGQGKIEVNLFNGGQETTVLGQLIDYDADNYDIALVAIRPGFQVQRVPVVATDRAIQTGQAVFSFGCDRGDDPSRRDTRINGINTINQDVGASNIEIAGAPIDGRSGGGLFDAQGRLIGVCNAADFKGDVGYYTGPGSIRWQLDRVNLARLYQSGANTNVAQAVAGIAPIERLASLPDRPAPAIAPASATMPMGNQEVIVIVRDRNNPDATTRVMNLQPTAELMRTLQTHAR